MSENILVLEMEAAQSEELLLDLDMSGGGEKYKEYTGEYTVIPSLSEQTLETKQKLMKENLTVMEIPYFETSNNSGGTTVYIGKEIEIDG